MNAVTMSALHIYKFQLISINRYNIGPKIEGKQDKCKDLYTYNILH